MSSCLTVVVPTYNRADYVGACLSSLQDSGVRDLEVIVVDDGSTDDTRARFDNDPRCLYARQDNQGPATARNHGVTLSRGRYLAFLDCDDLWLPGQAGRVLELLDACPQVDAIFTDARVGNDRDGHVSWIASAGQRAFFDLPHETPEPGFRVLERVPFFRRMARRNAVFIGALVMRRQAFDRVGGFEPTLCGAADWELWLRMASQMTFGYWPGPLAIYTRHDDNMSSHHDTMKTEFARALESVLRKCPHLASTERGWLRTCLRDMEYGRAWDAYDRGATRQARALFGRCLRLGGAGVMGYWLACCFPPGTVACARALKRAFAP